jgi:hypothetical protein
VERRDAQEIEAVRGRVGPLFVSSWWICPWDNQVVIDDASIMGIDCSAVPENVYLIWWYPHSGQGEILYKHQDRMPIREPFTDFSPYVHLFDKFLIAAMDRVPPISLVQAKLVKSRMVDALSIERPRGEFARSHKSNIAALSMVREVAEYDIMKGW